MTITVEEACKCESCGRPGQLVGAQTRILERGEYWDICVYLCDNKLCLKLDNTWAVQSNKNGIVYEREIGERGMDKTWKPMSSDQMAYGRRIVEDAIQQEHNHNE